MQRVASCPSGSRIFSDEALDRTYHFKWRSIRNLLYLTFTFSSHPPIFHLFNDLLEYPVTIFNFTAMALVIGMTYMCVDLFIKQYTKRLDWEQNLSPVLKGLTVPLILQSTLYCLLSLRYAGDGARYLTSSFAGTPIWSTCSQDINDSVCMGSKHILQHCQMSGRKELLTLNRTSVHIYYMEYMNSNIRGAWTWRFFVSAVIWVLNFCLTTTPDSVVLKFYKYVVLLKHVCSIITYAYLAISTGRAKEAFYRLVNINTYSSISSAVRMTTKVYGIGLVGVYDFGSTSSFTMIDNAVLIFTISFILISAIRSMSMHILVLELNQCLDVNDASSNNWHYMFFVIMPLSTEFVYGQKLINIYLYFYVVMSLLPCLMLYTLTVTRLIHSEYPSIKFIYTQGIICLFGFCCSVPILIVDQYYDYIRYGLIDGLNVTTLYLGGLRMAIIMWIYGVKNLSTDINFWLGFKPTKFWTLCWSVLPAFLLISFGYQIYDLSNHDMSQKMCAYVWFLVSALIVLGFQTKTIVHYVLRNNIMGAFRSKKKYGPFDATDCKRRRRYDVTIDHRQCYHDCVSLDEDIDCNHLPLMNMGGEGPTNMESDSLLMQMYEDVPSREESVVNIVDERPDTKEKKA